jgi:hypothetical protein
MRTDKFRVLLIVAVLYGAITSAWCIASLTEWLLHDGYVRYVALVLFASITVIVSGGLSWFLVTALVEWRRQSEHDQDLVRMSRQDRVFVRPNGGSGEFRELGAPPMMHVVIPARRKRPVLLEDAGLDDELYDRLSKGGSNGRQNGD